jgi:hypothetical protein
MKPNREPSFIEDCRGLKLGPSESFDRAFANVERHLAIYPKASSTEVREGTWLLRTRESFPEMAPVIVVYHLSDTGAVIYDRLLKDWSKDETPQLEPPTPAA